MPELAEVESARRVADAVARARMVTDVWADPSDDLVLTRPSEALREALIGARVTGTDRHGKYLWLTFDGRPCLLLHLGMTGSVCVPDVDPLRYQTGPRDPGDRWPPRFTKLLLTFDDGGQLAFTSARRLGRVRLVDAPRREPPVSELGFDPYTELPPLDVFAERLGRRARMLKAILLDQGFAAGVGNWIADEVLYQARLDPKRRPAELSAPEVEALWEALRDVVAAAVAADARAERFPAGWLFHRRWGKGKGEGKGKGHVAVDVDGHPLRFDLIGGRTTAWVPARQH